MSAERDFQLTIGRAQRLCEDARASARAAAHGRLPSGHRARLRTALRGLERAEHALIALRDEPWQHPCPDEQMEIPWAASQQLQL